MSELLTEIKLKVPPNGIENSNEFTAYFRLIFLSYRDKIFLVCFEIAFVALAKIIMHKRDIAKTENNYWKFTNFIIVLQVFTRHTLFLMLQ